MNSSKSTTYLSTALIVGGFLLIALAWNGAANEFLVDKQIPFLVSGGLTGIGMIGAGCTLALVQEIRKSALEINQHVDKLTSTIRGDAGEAPALSDTLPEPRQHTQDETTAGSGSSISREPATS
jgi:hypothetical protein